MFLSLTIALLSLALSLSPSHAGLQLHPRCDGDSAQHWSGYFVYPLFYLRTRTAFRVSLIYATTTINLCEYYNESAAPSRPWQDDRIRLQEDNSRGRLCHHLG